MTVGFDWLTFSLRPGSYEDRTVEDLVHDLFGLDYELFVPRRGFFGYSKGMFYENITVLYDGGVDTMGICFNISGQGCRFLYSLDDFSWDDLFTKVISLGGNFSRIDVALDCFDHEIDYNDLIDAIPKHNYTCRWRKVEMITSYYNRSTGAGVGFTANFGVKQSNCMLRIYDKKVESKRDDLDYWCRLEMQFRNDTADAMVYTYMQRDQDVDFVCQFIGILSDHLRFIDRRYERNASMCPVLGWWESFISSAVKSQFYDAKDYQDSTVERLVENVKRYSQSYRAFLDLYGVDALLDILSNVEVSKPSLKSLINYYKSVHWAVRDEVLSLYVAS